MEIFNFNFMDILIKMMMPSSQRRLHFCLTTFFRGLYAMSSHISRNAMKYAIVTFGDCCGLQKQKPLFYFMKNIFL